MPIYEYRCNKCNKDFEYLLRASSQAARCPFCNADEATRKLSAFAFYSRDSSGNIAAGSSCSGCASNNCSTCGH